jgi:hypothetical protein
MGRAFWPRPLGTSKALTLRSERLFVLSTPKDWRYLIMGWLFEWLKANWGLIALWGSIAAIFAVYIVRRVRKGEIQQVINEALAFVRELAKQAQAKIDREDVAFLAGLFYDAMVARTDLAKLISRDFLIEQVWQAWQRYIRIEATAQSAMQSKK